MAMAIHKDLFVNENGIGNVEIANLKDHAIQGTMLSVGLEAPETVVMDAEDFKKHIKKQMAQLLAEKMIENNLISFTVTNDPTTFNRMYRARAFLVPNDKVQILRVHAANSLKSK